MNDKFDKEYEQNGIEQAALDYKEKEYKFDAFISYRHLEPDQSIAKEVHKMIETFKAPKEFNIDGKRRTFRVFRDREELAAKDLSESIESALRNSRYLIVICSKRTKLSEWCIKEIQTFRKMHGDKNIIPVLIEGEPFEAFPWPLRELKRSQDVDTEDLQDVLAADLRPKEIINNNFLGYDFLEKNDKKRLIKLTKESKELLKFEKYRIMATILGCTFGDLKQRDKERKNKLIISISSIVAAALLVFGLFMANAYNKAEKARKIAVQSNASILLKNSRDLLKDGDKILAILIAKEATKSIDESMDKYEKLKAEENLIYNDSIYNGGPFLLTAIPTKNKLTFFSISKDGRLLAFGKGNNKTAIYNTQNGALIKEFSDHKKQVKLVGFSIDNRYLASSSFDETTIIYDIEKNEKKAVIEFLGIPVLTKFSNDGSKLFLACINKSGTVFKVYNAKNFELIHELAIEEKINFAKINDNGEEVLILTGNDSKEQFTRRSLKDGKIIDSFPQIKDNLSLNADEDTEYFKNYEWADYSKDNKSVIAYAGGELIKYSLDKKQILFRQSYALDIFSSYPYETSNGEKIFLKSSNKIEIIDGKTGISENSIFFENLTIEAFAYHEKTNCLIVSSTNGNLAIWKDNIIIENNLNFGKGVPKEIAFIEDGSKVIASSHENQIIKIVDINPKLIENSINAQIVASSIDSTKILFFDGTEFFIKDGEAEIEKINIDKEGLINYIPDTKNYKISNDKKYIQRLVTLVKEDEPKTDIAIIVADTETGAEKQIKVQTAEIGFGFTWDSKKIILSDEIEGVRIIDIESEKIIKSFPKIQTNSHKILIGKSEDIFVINKLSGTSEIYDLNSGDLIEEIPGESLYIDDSENKIKIIGIDNNSGFIWQRNAPIEQVEFDEICSETPITFSDINLYNKEKDILLMVRNNEIEKICYLIDFKTGHLIMTFAPSVNRYNICANINPNGDTIYLDQYYYNSFDAKTQLSQSNLSTSVYEILTDEEMLKEIEKICDNRVLTETEKSQIGIESENSEQK
ncbi:MAG: TIR domain-containing protein [Tissierellia bacterium]|nr:TIR domain-containing protein [Tissierellia bacterium]